MYTVQYCTGDSTMQHRTTCTTNLSVADYSTVYQLLFLSVHTLLITLALLLVTIMPVRLRLQRFGRTHSPFYRMVAANSFAPRDGKFLEIVRVCMCLDRGRSLLFLTKCRSFLRS
jgi:Ribosomal protein S16